MPTPCPFCNRPTDPGSRTCTSCGAPLVKRCPFCAEEIHLLAKICRYCRTPIEEPDRKRPDAG